jgi:hypothetical protein
MLHVDMFADNKSGTAYQDKSRRPEKTCVLLLRTDCGMGPGMRRCVLKNRRPCVVYWYTKATCIMYGTLGAMLAALVYACRVPACWLARL